MKAKKYKNVRIAILHKGYYRRTVPAITETVTTRKECILKRG